MKAVAYAHKNRNLQEFETTLATYTNELNNDPIIRTQLAALYDTLLEQNLVRIIEPFSRVEISHIADMVKLPTQQVEAKLSQMILDKKFHGILDQGAGCLIVFDEPEEDKTYETAVETLKQVDKVVSSLYQKVRRKKTIYFIYTNFLYNHRLLSFLKINKQAHTHTHTKHIIIHTKKK